MQCPEQAILWRQKVDHWLPGAGGWEWVGKCEMSANVCRHPFWNEEKVLRLDFGEGCTSL